MARRLFASAVGIASCLGMTSAVTPTQQVINMLSEMKAKGVKMMDTEQKIYATYEQWVDDETTKLGFEIQTGERTINDLISRIDEADTHVKQLAAAISALEDEINTLEGEKASAIKTRKAQHAEYMQISQDYSESVDALKKAIQVMSAQNYDRAQAEMLLQRMSTTVPGMTRVLAAFLQTKGRSSLRGDGAPAVAAYEFQSSGIVTVLEGLYSKFKQELADVEEDETNQAHEFTLVEMHLSNTIKKDSSDRDEKAVTKAKRASDAAKARGALAETRASKAADENLKAEMESVFAAKTMAFKENQKVRVDELDALAKAIEILSSPAVSGSYANRINLAQTSKLSFIQLGRSHRRVSKTQKVAQLLRRHATALGSKDLATLANSVAGNPFEKVIGMIEDLLAKLKENASAEAEHKAWCDDQLKTNKLKRNEKTSSVNDLVSQIQGMEANIAAMGATIQTLAEEQAELQKNMNTATTLRDSEKTENLAIIADAKAGFDAVGKALVILREFYSSQSSLLQQQQVPEMAAYKGQQNSNTGIVGMLEVIQTDFARLRADTEASEHAAANEYAGFMKQAKATKLQKHNEEFELSLKKDQVEYENVETKKDLTTEEAALAKAKQYFEELKPMCLIVHVSWEERVARRKEEIEALKEAYNVLDQKSSD